MTNKMKDLIDAREKMQKASHNFHMTIKKLIKQGSIIKFEARYDYCLEAQVIDISQNRIRIMSETGKQYWIDQYKVKDIIS